MNPCYLCGLLTRNKTILWENDFLFATFDTCPVSPGHVLISPKRHVADFFDLIGEEFGGIRNAIKQIIPIIESTNLVSLYIDFIRFPESEQSTWFCKRALKSIERYTKPKGYNHGFNDGKAAGRTVDHFHWHIIPRYDGDIADSKGGIRFVIPEMGDYSKKK